MWLSHSWGWKPPQSASCIHIRHVQSVWAHSYASHRHMIAAFHSYTQLGSDFVLWVICGVKTMWLCHDWGWQPPETAPCIHIRHVQSVWVHWYNVHRHMVVALHSYSHPTWLGFWGTVSLMVEADSHIKLLPTSILDICKVFEHIGMLSMGIKYNL